MSENAYALPPPESDEIEQRLATVRNLYVVESIGSLLGLPRLQDEQTTGGVSLPKGRSLHGIERSYAHSLTKYILFETNTTEEEPCGLSFVNAFINTEAVDRKLTALQYISDNTGLTSRYIPAWVNEDPISARDVGEYVRLKTVKQFFEERKVLAELLAKARVT